MPTVPRISGPTVTTQPVRGPKARAQPGDDSIAKALMGVAVEFERAQQQVDETQAQEALIQFEREKNAALFAPGTGYLNQKGKNAMLGAGDANENLLKMQRRYAEGLSPEGQRIFNQKANAHVTRSQQSIMAHATKEQNVWRSEVYKNEVENTMENAALLYGSAGDLRVHEARGVQATLDRARTLGLDPALTKEAVENYRSDFYSTAIKAAIAQKDFDRANEMMNSEGIKSLLEGDDRVALQKSLADAQETSRLAHKTILLQNEGGTLEQMYANADAMSESPEEQVKLRRAAKDEWTIRKNQKKIVQEETYERLSQMQDDGTPYDQLPAGDKDTITSAQKRQLQAEWKAKVNGTNLPDQPDYITRIEAMPPGELANTDVATLGAKSPNGSFSKGDKDKAAKAIRAAKEGQANPKRTAARNLITASGALAENLLGKKKSKLNPETYQTVQQELLQLIIMERDLVLEQRKAAGEKDPVFGDKDLLELEKAVSRRVLDDSGFFGRAFAKRKSILEMVEAEDQQYIAEAYNYLRRVGAEPVPKDVAEMAGMIGDDERAKNADK